MSSANSRTILIVDDAKVNRLILREMLDEDYQVLEACDGNEAIDLIREHVEKTGSPRGKEILENFGEYLPKFKKVLPHDYDKMLRLIAQMEEKGEDSEQAQIEAFYAMKNAK